LVDKIFDYSLNKQMKCAVYVSLLGSTSSRIEITVLCSTRDEDVGCCGQPSSAKIMIFRYVIR